MGTCYEEQMESFDDEASLESYLRKNTETYDSLEAKEDQLTKIKEEIKRAKDRSTQSWLDSKPLIDELEHLQSELVSTKNRISMSSTIITELETELNATNMTLRSKKEEELKAKTVINEINQALDKTHMEMENVKVEIDETRRERAKLKQTLRMKRQTLRAMQLKLRSVRIESEAFGASAAEALRFIILSTEENERVQLSQADYYALTRRATEETSLAEWRVSVSKQQRVAAEVSQHSALRRLKEIHSENRLRKRGIREEKIVGEKTENIRRREDERDLRVRVNNNRETTFPKARAKVTSEFDHQERRQQLRSSSKNKNSRIFIKKKRSSILRKIRGFIVKNINRLLG